MCASCHGVGSEPQKAHASRLAASAVAAADSVASHGATIPMVRVAGSSTDPHVANMRQQAVSHLRHS